MPNVRMPAFTSVEELLFGAMAPIEAEAQPAGAATGPTVVAGLVGRGIQASRTPHMHQAEGDRLGMRYHYRAFDFDALGLDDRALPRMIDAAAHRGFAGLNVTHPFKETVAACLDELSPEASAIGAVNTIVVREGRTIGHNTDCWGFAESFRRGMRGVKLDKVVLLGAGGAGAAVARALFDLGIERLAIFDVDRPKVARLAARLTNSVGMARVSAVQNLEAAVREANGLVNATPVGMAKYPGSPVDPACLRADLWVADIVYFPEETELLRAASATGCRTLPGSGMAVFQAVKAFHLITGRIPDAQRMARHFEAAKARHQEGVDVN